MVLSEKQKERIIATRCGEIEVNQKKYFYKPSPRHVDGIELVIESLSDLVGINCAHYERVEIDGMPYVLSEDIANGKTFKTAREIIQEQDVTAGSLYDIWDLLGKKYPKDIKKIMFEVVKIYIFDLIVLESDRSLGNWGILFDKNRVDKVYILDNEYSFDEEYPAILDSHFGFELENKKQEKNNMNNIENFMNTSSDEFKSLFRQMYSTLTPEIIKGCMEDIEYDIGDNFKLNREIFYSYLKNYDEIDTLLNKRGLR